jgi:Mn2+/Fe2+ NRAMP family transporter
VIILSICLIILFVGKYKLLDKLIKIIICTLAISTILAVTFAYSGNTTAISFSQTLPTSETGVLFLIAFMGWMPAPLDISVWHSLWTIEKKKTTKELSPKSAISDFNVGYIGTLFLGLCFLLLGAFIMYNSGEVFSNKASVFSNQLINMYTKSLGNWAYLLIGIAALTTMFSTTITTLDASPRAMKKTSELLFNKSFRFGYTFWILILVSGTLCIFTFFSAKMKDLIYIATVLSFITAPFYAIVNYRLISSKHTPKAWRPSLPLHILSILGILFLLGFSAWYLSTL